MVKKFSFCSAFCLVLLKLFANSLNGWTPTKRYEFFLSARAFSGVNVQEGNPESRVFKSQTAEFDSNWIRRGCHDVDLVCTPKRTLCCLFIVSECRGRERSHVHPTAPPASPRSPRLALVSFLYVFQLNDPLGVTYVL